MKKREQEYIHYCYPEDKNRYRHHAGSKVHKSCVEARSSRKDSVKNLAILSSAGSIVNMPELL